MVEIEPRSTVPKANAFPHCAISLVHVLGFIYHKGHAVYAVLDLIFSSLFPVSHLFKSQGMISRVKG